MAWTAPGTAVDGTVLSAAFLNIVRDDLEYLYGLSSGVNVPQSARSLSITGAYGPNIWTFRHKADWLNIFLAWEIDTGWVDHFSFELRAGATVLYSADPWPVAASGAQFFAFDTSGLVIGDWYTLYLEIQAHTPEDPAIDHGYVAGIKGSTFASSSQFFESATDYS
jgi:hypothetical protein